MALIPIQNPLESRIEHQEIETPHRPYLGYSQLGHSCARYLWYSFRWAYKNTYSPRMMRLFERGNHEENLIIRDLYIAGVNVHSTQLEVNGIAGHVKGHIDGIAENVPQAPKTDHLFEAKTANDKRFKAYKRVPLDAKGHANKRVKEWSPSYYGQVNGYMKKLRLTRCLFVVVNKNTEERIYDRLHYDEAEAEIIEEKALTVLLSPFPLNKIGESTWHECKMCNARGICHMKETPERNCRTCEHVSLEDNGIWRCENFANTGRDELDEDAQRTGCHEYTLAACLKPDFGKDASD